MDSQRISSKSKRVKGNRSLAADKTAPSGLSQPDQAISPRTTALLPRDELLLIDGLDPVAEMALNSIGIRKFTDFRGYTPETLAQALLERAGTAIAATTIAEQGWIGWAELHAAEAEKGKTVAEPPANAGLHDEISPAAQPQIAETILPESENLATPEAANREMDLSIRQARFQQFDKPAAPNTVTTKFLRGEIDCHVAGAEASGHLADRVPLCTQVFAVDTATAAHQMLAAQWGCLEPDRAEYRFDVEFVAPPVGRYQLQIVTLLLAANPKIASSQGPFLRVIP